MQPDERAILLYIARTQLLQGEMLQYLVDQVPGSDDAALIALTVKLKMGHDGLQAAINAAPVSPS